MKKSIIALAAVGAVAGTASAQTNVTIYGVADAGISRIDNGRNNTTALSSGNQSGSRIGFRSKEDLGGGLSAIFTLENGYSIDDGTLGQGGRLFGRQAFVGLAGGFGAVKLGRQYNPIRTAVESVDPFGHGLAGNAANVFNVHGERADNSINYTAPNLGGFTGQVQYSFGEAVGSTSLGRQFGLSAGYAAGPLKVILAYHDQNLTTTTAGATVANGDSQTTMLGGVYDFRVAKLHAAYARSEAENAAGVSTTDRDDAMIGVSAPIGAGTILASYIRRSEDVGGGTADANQWAIGYTHALSKRTNLYTSYARIKNDATARVGSPAAAGLDPSVFNVGIRHRF